MHVQKIACGSAHNAALARSDEESKELVKNQVYTWGLGADYRLGHVSDENKPVPTKVNFFVGYDVEDIACGFMHTAVICGGKLFTFGQNEFGQLGTGDKKIRELPHCVNEKAFVGDVRQVSCGGFHTVCICADNKIYSWGNNESGNMTANIG